MIGILEVFASSKTSKNPDTLEIILNFSSPVLYREQYYCRIINGAIVYYQQKNNILLSDYRAVVDSSPLSALAEEASMGDHL
ncbi:MULTISPECIES: hypothetical protein [Azotobacter]|uniref:hypothetical protein n=1 Tax=Azotobacter TaxID=352 RepID=UPI00005278E2|nr:hypothetical protein [Azotobacter vinelandii]